MLGFCFVARDLVFPFVNLTVFFSKYTGLSENGVTSKAASNAVRSWGWQESLKRDPNNRHVGFAGLGAGRPGPPGSDLLIGRIEASGSRSCLYIGVT